MAGHAVKKIDDMEAVYLGAFKRVRAELGVESFGIQVIDLPPNFENTTTPRTARRRSSRRCAAAARSRSGASASLSTRSTSPGSPLASSARFGQATRVSAC